MVSTIVDAEQVYKGGEAKHTHKDELWIWIPRNAAASDLLKRFLGVFTASPGLKHHPLEVEIFGEKADELARIFQEGSERIVQKVTHTKGPSIAVLRFDPGLLNSRKSMVTPFLPKGA